LLDTHVLLWWQAGSSRLSEAASARLKNGARRQLSAISCWEVAMLSAKGRIELDRPVAAWFSDLITQEAIQIVEVTSPIAVKAGELSHFHGDPADRIIYATASETGATLITKDRMITDFADSSGDVDAVW